MSQTKTFFLPDLGEGLPDATIVEWFVKPGDVIRLDAPRRAGQLVARHDDQVQRRADGDVRRERSAGLRGIHPTGGCGHRLKPRACASPGLMTRHRSGTAASC